MIMRSIYSRGPAQANRVEARLSMLASCRELSHGVSLAGHLWVGASDVVSRAGGLVG